MITEKITPIHDRILVTDMNFDEQITSSGIIIGSDDGKVDGIKPRWGKVWAIGSKQTNVHVGEWILIEHGRWTRGFKINENDNIFMVRGVDNNAILAISDYCPSDITLGG